MHSNSEHEIQKDDKTTAECDQGTTFRSVLNGGAGSALADAANRREPPHTGAGQSNPAQVPVFNSAPESRDNSTSFPTSSFGMGGGSRGVSWNRRLEKGQEAKMAAALLLRLREAKTEMPP